MIDFNSDNISFADAALIFKAFCDEKRLGILAILGEGEHCVCDLTDRLDMGQSALSYHMKILVRAGIVQARQNGKWTHYSINVASREPMANLLLKLTQVQPEEGEKGECVSSSCCS